LTTNYTILGGSNHIANGIDSILDDEPKFTEVFKDAITISKLPTISLPPGASK